MKPKPKFCQYANRARRIPRKIIALEHKIKELDLADLPDAEDQREVFQHRTERAKQLFRNSITITNLANRYDELQRLGYASGVMFLLSLVK